MTVSREVEAEIRRLAHAEGWPNGTIAKELAVHHEVVARVLDAEHGTSKERAPRPAKLDGCCRPRYSNGSVSRSVVRRPGGALALGDRSRRWVPMAESAMPGHPRTRAGTPASRELGDV